MTSHQHLTYWESLCSARSTWDARWQRILEWVTPHQAYVTRRAAPGSSPASLANMCRIHDTTGIEGVNTLADSHMSSLVPLGSVWLKLAPPDKYQDHEEIVRWYETCGGKLLALLGDSNFYTAVYSLFRDRSGPGTGAMYIMRGKDAVLSFTYMPLGSYAAAQNEEGIIDVLYRRFELTCTEAVAKFLKTEDGDPPNSSQIRARLGDAIADSYEQAMAGDAKKMAEKHAFIHGVRPRLKRDPKMIDALNMPYESVYIVEKSKLLAEEGGFEDFPFVVSRFEKWGDEPYGYSPAYNALPNIITANYLVKLLKAIGEAKALPRLFVLAGQKRQVDMRAGGQTVVSKEEASMNFPRQWQDTGDFQLGQWLLEREREQIGKFLYTNLFKTFSNLSQSVLGNMTAEVAKGLKNENLLLLAPSFTQFTTDFRAGIHRMFAVAMEAGAFGPPPEDLLRDTAVDGIATIPSPKVNYVSRVALALKDLEDQAADEWLGALHSAAQSYPDIMDLADLDRWAQLKALVKGVNLEIVREMDDVVKLRQGRAEQAQQVQQAAMAQSAAQTAATASKANPQVLQQLSQSAG